MIVTKPAIRYMGAKFRLAPWLLQFFPAHELYAGMLGDWRREETDSRIAASRGTKVRREIVWINPACEAALQRLPGGLWAA